MIAVDIVGARNSASLRDLRILMDDSAESITPNDVDIACVAASQRSQWCCLTQRSMRSMRVEMGLILGQDVAEMTGVEDEHPVKELSSSN